MCSKEKGKANANGHAATVSEAAAARQAPGAEPSELADRLAEEAAALSISHGSALVAPSGLKQPLVWLDMEMTGWALTFPTALLCVKNDDLALGHMHPQQIRGNSI